MSPMLDIQKRHAEVFRLRMGEKGRNGAPVKLTDAIRVTSFSETVVEAFTDVYGGEVQPWTGAPNGEQFQAKLPTTEVSIMVLPGQSLDQWWELYRGSVCERRCDGYTESLSGGACKCPADIAQRLKATGACRPMTRLHVLCPDVEVVGAGTLVTHGMIAAETLPQSVAVAEAALRRGLMVPGTLRVVEHKGKRHYIVPQVEIVGVSLNELTTGEAAPRLALANERAQVAPAPRAAIAAPAQRVPAPVAPERAETPAPPPAQPRSADQAPELPPLPDELGATVPETPANNTVEEASREPSTPQQHPVGLDDHDQISLGGGGGTVATTAATPPPPADDLDRTALLNRLRALPADLAKKAVTVRDQKGYPKVDEMTEAQVNPFINDVLVHIEKEAKSRARAVALSCKQAGLESDEDRHALIAYCTDGAATSAKTLTEVQADHVKSAARDIKEGALVMVVTDDGTTFMPGGTTEA